jgi:hypothetical protein
MVTLATGTSRDYAPSSALLQKSMTSAPIHWVPDDSVIWQGVIKNIRRADIATGRPRRILVGLAGYTLRSGSLALGPSIHHAAYLLLTNVTIDGKPADYYNNGILPHAAQSNCTPSPASFQEPLC